MSEHRLQQQSTPKVKPRLIIHGGAGNIHRNTYPPEKFQAYRRTLVDIVSLHILPTVALG